MKLLYDRIRMLKLVHSDRYLLTIYLDMMELNINEDIVIKSIFKMYVEQESKYWKAYENTK